MVYRDFNEILYSFEKVGGAPREQSRMEEFREVLEEFQLMEICFLGTWFTWERGNLSETKIHEKLDKGVANLKWTDMFPTTIFTIYRILFLITIPYCLILILNQKTCVGRYFNLRRGR